MRNVHPTLRLSDLVKKGQARSASWQNDTIRYTYNARAAIYQVLRSLPPTEGNTILVPTFHCPTVVEPMLHSGYQVRFYRINEDLSINFQDVSHKLSPEVRAIIIINYFGFPAAIEPVLAGARESGSYVIEDCAHSFLTSEPVQLAGGHGDASVFSFYKLVPSHVGGGFRINNTAIHADPPSSWAGLKNSLIILKRLVEQAVENSADGLFKAMLLALEKKRVQRKHKQDLTLETRAALELVANPYPFSDEMYPAAIPWASAWVLQHSNLDETVALRRQNYRLLDKHLKETDSIRKVFPNLPSQVCPWAYPVLVKNRDACDDILREAGVPVFTFGNVLHPLLFQCASGDIAAAEYLSNNLLMIPIHQNLDAETVLSFAGTLNTLLRDENERKDEERCAGVGE